MTTQAVRRRVNSLAIAMEDIAILRLGKNEWTVPASVLRYHSSVLDGILADGAPTEEGRVVTLDGGVSVKEVVNAKPSTAAIFAILKHDDSMDWMTADTLDFLMKEFLTWFNREKVSATGQDGLTTLQAARATLEDMPPSVVNAFLLYVMGRPDLEIRQLSPTLVDLRQQRKAT